MSPRRAAAALRVGSRAHQALDAVQAAYLERAAAVGLNYDAEVAQDIKRLKLGRTRGSTNPKVAEMRRRPYCSAQYAAACLVDEEFPDLRLPEVALAGRSNSGKSSLLNALCGIQPRMGPASVSSVEGWTRGLQFFEVQEFEEDEPLMTLVDFPGYGPATASKAVRTSWAAGVRRYLRDRAQLKCVFVLVDCTRGVTADDTAFMERLDRAEKPFHVIVTKADLLAPETLAQSSAHPRRHPGAPPELRRRRHADDLRAQPRRHERLPRGPRGRPHDLRDDADADRRPTTTTRTRTRTTPPTAPRRGLTYENFL